MSDGSIGFLAFCIVLNVIFWGCINAACTAHVDKRLANIEQRIAATQPNK